jgi:MFS family permease
LSAAATAHPTRAARILYGAGFSYMITLGATQVLVPLYALHLGYDLGRLGVLVASQAVFGLVLRVSGGAMADRFGERWVLWFSFLTMVAGSVVFALTDQFWVLIAGQTFMGFSRAAYWTSTQSYASRIDPARAPVFLGRINSSGTAGNVFGTFGAGLLVLPPSPRRGCWAPWASRTCRGAPSRAPCARRWRPSRSSRATGR